MKILKKTKFTSFSKKNLLQILFIFFILLNIIDFIGYLKGDFDFFKKLLSWLLIGYVFYKSSPTKIFMGTRNKIFDLFLIIAFSLMTIVKSLMHYVNLDSIKQTKFVIFDNVISYLQNIDNRLSFEQTLFVTGLLITIIICVYLLSKTSVKKDSLIGSFNFKGYLKFIGIEYLILILSMIFFSLIVFNFFMEWFALAVDSLILIIGLIYYTLKYLHSHTNIKTSKLGTISNTGNQFYQNLIKYFSNKNTFLIGVSFLLTIHLLVDIGVYLVPYSIGNTNSLYSQTINTPIFNIFNFENSRFISDMKISNSFLTDFTILIGHLSTIILYFLLMFGPFYYFYKFIQKIKTHSKPIIKHLFLTSVILYLTIYLLPSFNLPITLDMPNINSGIAGVELKTSQLINFQSSTIMIETIIFLIVFILTNIGIYILTKYNFSKFFKYKLMPLISIIFFMLYISIFFVSVINIETQNLQKNYLNIPTQQNEGKYQEIISKIENKEIRKYSSTKIKSIYFQLIMTPIREKKNDSNYNEYIILNLKNINLETEYELKNIENLYFENNNDYNDYKFKNKDINLIYNLENENENNKLFENGISPKKLIEIISPIINPKSDSTITFFELFRFLFTAIFYIFGTFAFVRFFIKWKILD